MLNSACECLSSHTSQRLTRAAELVTSPPCTARQRSDSKLRTGKRRNQDLLFGADQFLVLSQLHGDVRADHVPDHGRPVPLQVPYDAIASLRVRGCRAADRQDWQAFADLRLSARGVRTQIVPLGVTSGSHTKDQVAEHIGGSGAPPARGAAGRCPGCWSGAALRRLRCWVGLGLGACWRWSAAVAVRPAMPGPAGCAARGAGARRRVRGGRCRSASGPMWPRTAQRRSVRTWSMASRAGRRPGCGPQVGDSPWPAWLAASA